MSLDQFVNYYDYSNIGAFVERFKQETLFASCLSNLSDWHTDGEIRWSLDDKGLLTIGKVAGTNGTMTDYEYDWAYAFDGFNYPNDLDIDYPSVYGRHRSTAPWMEWKEKIIFVQIESGVTSIGDEAFDNCDRLTSVEISSGVQKIGNSAFHSCSSLRNVTIPDSVTIIGKNAFHSCSSLTKVTIPDSVQEIGSKAFVETGLTQVELPAHTKVAEDAFFLIIRRK